MGVLLTARCTMKNIAVGSWVFQEYGFFIWADNPLSHSSHGHKAEKVADFELKQYHLVAKL